MQIVVFWTRLITNKVRVTMDKLLANDVVEWASLVYKRDILDIIGARVPQMEQSNQHKNLGETRWCGTKG